MLRWLAVWLMAGASVFAQVHEGRTLVTPSLVADTTAVVPGRPFKVGLLLQTVPKWHTYWEYSGDAGFPTEIKWALPPGFEAGPIEWPLPERLLEPGDIEVYAYGEKVLLLTTVTVPADVKETSVTLKADVAWLVCEEICIPGKAQLELTLPVQPQAEMANQELFQEFLTQIPSSEAPPYQLAWKNTGPAHLLTISGLGSARSVDVYPLPAEGQQVDHPKPSPVTDGQATVEINIEGDVRGVLVVDGPEGRRGWFVSSASAPSPTGGLSLWLALFYGFLGGLILNLMPCVLPVISLKIFGFIRQAGDDRGSILRHGLAFTAGIFTWFLGLALLIIILKNAGHQVTWAFQFQNPWFNFGIACIVFVFALNLFGVFEIVLPGKAQNALTDASGGEGYAGSFFQGIFATLLATPCTAPFLGASLGFAFSQSAVVILAIFAAISLGMAAPYLLLSAQPGWMKVLPRPGAWMERVKQFMGFPLLATLIWLLFILGAQKGLEAVIWVASFLLVLAMACWILGAFASPLQSARSRALAWVVCLLLIGAGGWYFIGQKFVASRASGSSQPAKEGGIPWQPFSQAALDEAIASGQPVFVDFTADWCISCKYNEKTAIDIPEVRKLVEERKIIMIKADWTNENPEITAILKQHGRVGVPFYLLYPGGGSRQPSTLPEILTPGTVLDAFGRVK